MDRRRSRGPSCGKRAANFEKRLVPRAPTHWGEVTGPGAPPNEINERRKEVFQMAERRIRVTPVRRDEVDVEKLVAGLMLLVEQLAQEDARDTQDEGVPPEEPAA